MNPKTLALMAATASATSVTFDPGYDDSTRSLNSVACSDGVNGLETRFGWQVQGQIPHFPYIGGADFSSWNSPLCGSCWQLTFQSNTIFVVAVDHAASGFNIGLTAMNALTNGQGANLGRVDVTAVQTAASNCGM